MAESKVENRDAHAIERMENHGPEQSHFQELECRSLKKCHGFIKGLGSLAQSMDCTDVQKQIEQQQHTCHPLDQPRQHSAVLPAILSRDLLDEVFHEIYRVSAWPF